MAVIGFNVLLAAFFLLPLLSHADTVIVSQPFFSTQITTAGNDARIPQASGHVTSFGAIFAGVNGFPGADAIWHISCYQDSSYSIACPSPNTWTITVPELSVTFNGVATLYTTTNISGGTFILYPDYFYTITQFPNNHFTLYGTSTTSFSQNYFLYGDYDTSGLPWNNISFVYLYSSTSQAIATSSGLWSSLSLASSTQSCSSDNIFTSALCAVGTYLFIPNTAILDATAQLPNLAADKFPFSWYTGMRAGFTNLSASTTANMGLLQMDFSAYDPATSTPFHGILPNASFLSSTTINKYMPSGTIELWLFLESCAIWVVFAFHQYWMIKHKWLHH